MNTQRETVKRLWQQVKSIHRQAIPRMQNKFVSSIPVRQVQTEDAFIRRNYQVDTQEEQEESSKSSRKNFFIKLYIVALLFGLTGGSYYYLHSDFEDRVAQDIVRLQSDFDKQRLPMHEVKKEALATVAKLMPMNGYEFVLLEDYLQSNQSSLPSCLKPFETNFDWSKEYNTLLQTTVQYYMKPTISLDNRFVDTKQRLLRETQLEVQVPILCYSKEGKHYHLFIAKLKMHNLVPDNYLNSKLDDCHFIASKVEMINPYQYLKRAMHVRDLQPFQQLFSYWTLGMKSSKSIELDKMFPGGFRVEKYWTKTEHSIKLKDHNTPIDLSLHHF